jgi:hypothetical protein
MFEISSQLLLMSITSSNLPVLDTKIELGVFYFENNNKKNDSIDSAIESPDSVAGLE